MRFHRDVNNSGGLLVTKACHDFDLIGHLLESRPDRVFSAQYKRFFGKGGPDARVQCGTCDRTAECDWDRMSQQPNRAAKRKYAKIYLDDDKVTTDGYSLDLCCWRGDTELKDLSHVMLEYENGIPAVYSQVLFSPLGNRIFKVFGDSGSLVFDENERSVTVMDRWNTRTDKIVTKPKNDMHGGSDTGVVAAFFKMVREDAEPESTIEDGVWALAVAEAAYESAAKEKWVKVKPLVDQVIS
jgi:predicted dehydrogenase